MLAEYLVHVGRVNVFLDPETKDIPKCVADLKFPLPLTLSRSTPINPIIRSDTIQLVISCPPVTYSDEIQVPWKAIDLNKDDAVKSTIKCKQCQSFLTSISSWKDLPSANWMEMLDCWSCHTDYPTVLSKRGGPSMFQPTDDCAYLGTSYVLIRLQSLEGKVAYGPNFKLHCSFCNAELGLPNNKDSSNGVRLDKSSICIDDQKIHPSFIVASEILTLRDMYATHKFVIVDGERSIWTWCFVPHLPISFQKSPFSSIEFANSPISTIKLLYQLEVPPDFTKSSEDWMDIPVSSHAFDEISHVLEKGNLSFPVSAQKFGPWKVGLLPKFHKQMI
ncbi:cleavage and polyadenylation HECT-type ubiquitin-protein ligase E3 Ipa1 [Schizosaccharomyces pombe]|uniref:Uncharacterized protein C1734.10c n=1 Tax=Schizosaccharomyces pombe (strain 972 / ATCC 24843) TaxID=284812 RepID=YHFA_SCHPO|nr:putative mRNA processing protein [Schizosaccharomyces pombe]O74751.1 RecName: Full=Uncharacterized protein C1734.10c [Schizosaccharomyces pombe 972h-]CAA21304.1 mRNA processing protein (predicted) [Schizosaccharomyces pombe]|eukprot:NP_595427.1 putative mRNA processing protein [Schizosaccharomyces pombe]